MLFLAKGSCTKGLIPDPAPKDTGLNPACQGSTGAFFGKKDLAQKGLIPDPTPKDTGLNPACQGSTGAFLGKRIWHKKA